MATPAQTQVTLDASQFISAVEQIGNSIDAMNKNLLNAGTAFTNFANSSANIEKELQSVNSAMAAQKTATEATTKAVQALTQAQQQQLSVLGQIAISTRAAAQSLDAMATASTKAGQAGARGGQAFMSGWDGIVRLLAVTVIRRLFLDIAGAIQSSIQASADYTEQVGRIVAVNQNLGVSVEGLSNQFTNLSLAYGRTLKEVADVGRIAATSGGAQTGQQIEQITNASLRLAEVVGTTGPAAATAITAVSRAFQMTADEAQHVSNQLVHLAQSGISVEAIGPSLGRVSSQAQRLGISFSELGLLMETLKARGLSDVEVMSQVGAVLNSLERPTARMNELMGAHGFLSPQQLIQAQRLHGALQLINQDMSEGNINARQATQSRRAGGGLNAAEEFAQRSQANPLDNVNQLQAGADAALRVVDATGKWNDELEKIKTTFQSQVAPAIIKSILDVFEPMGGLAKVVTDAGRTIALLVDPIARVVSWFAVWTGWLERTAELLGLLDSRTRISRQTMQWFTEAMREGAAAQDSWVASQRQLSRQTTQQGQQQIGNMFAPINQALHAQGELQRERVHQLGEDIQASSKSIFSAFGAQIESLESAARHAESRITESLKRVAEFSDKTDKDAFNHRLKTAGEVTQVNRFTNPQQANNAYSLLQSQNSASNTQVNLVTSRRRRLEQEIAALQAKGDADSIASARRKFEELRSLNDQEADIRQASARRNAEYEGRRTGQSQTYNPFNREREAGARRLNAAEAAFEEANRRRLAAQQAQLEKINRALREQYTLVQTGQRDVGRLPQQLFGPDGHPREGFRGANGAQAAGTLISGTIDRQIERVQALPASIERGIQDALRSGSITQEQARQARARAPSPQEIAGLVAQLEQQKIATQALFLTAEAKRVSEANQNRANELLASIARNTELAITRVAETRNQQRGILTEAQTQVNRLREQIPTSATLLQEGTGAAGSRARSRFLQAIEEFDRRNARAAQTGDQGDIERARAQAALVVQHAENLQRLRGQNGPQPGIDQLRATVERLAATLEQRAIRENALGTEQQLATTVTNAVRNALAAAGGGQPNANGVIPPATVQQSITAFENLATALNPTGAFPNALTELATSTATSARNIAAATANLQAPRPAANPAAAPAPAGVNPNVVEGYASGGLIGNAFSSFGPDNTMIHARRGEFVVNPEDTRKWYSTLVAINRGDKPRGGGYAHGGTVTTSIGNMNFHVSGADHPQQTAQAVLKIIRREQRRGNA